jgi:uncharacterized C2H2 Zn-finger protein
MRIFACKYGSTHVALQAGSPGPGEKVSKECFMLAWITYMHCYPNDIDLMHSEPLQCDACGMVFAVPEDLATHRTAVHIDGQLQCQSCGRFFEDNETFDRHASEDHSNSSQANLGQKQIHECKIDDVESLLLKRTMEEEKARKRTRGPYRKSSAA